MSDKDKVISTDLIEGDKILIDEKSKIKDKKNEEKLPFITNVYNGVDFGYLERKNNQSNLYTQPSKEEFNLKKYNGKYFYFLKI